MDALDGALRGLGSAGESADTVGHAVEMEGLIPKEAVFIITAEFSDVGKCGTAEMHESGSG
jgi:hypothetical protein